MASIRKDLIEYLRIVRDNDLLSHMNRWRMMDDLHKIGIDFNDNFWVRKDTIRNIYKAVMDSLLDD